MAENDTQSQVRVCQSCGLPFDEGHLKFIAKEPNGEDSIYCCFCYKDGAFLNPDATIAEMIEIGVPHLAAKIGEPAAREAMRQLIPTLARWRVG
ncbi:MAG: zinc ribbon domain-containing protein [Coriobacteriia bacterium]|nr:zinc ribbon domain-containing protein [Coriobacteriia bacterium]